jgi:hypothetical protein
MPVILLTAFIVFKLNHEHKRLLFKVPIWISSTALSLGIGHLAGGVMGFYAAAFCDLLLYPIMLLVKKRWDSAERKKNQIPNKQKVDLPLALPQRGIVHA